ncbi:hypothetical protein GCM10010964_24560 [Caldovatus sediminis]|uniref:Uncharacterized protein n=1 Tax=Caldovatus sediminis TaxID=2041189 RepID=A0A8J2ZBL8_9PROT|nr:hypothetical protein GCM10010964_24560 [Caldovatus sediminis]
MRDGAISGLGCRVHAGQFLAPRPRPGDTVVPDDPGNREIGGVRAAVGARLLLLPPDRPDPNPIGPVFAELAALLGTPTRRTGPRASLVGQGRASGRFRPPAICPEAVFARLCSRQRLPRVVGRADPRSRPFPAVRDRL